MSELVGWDRGADRASNDADVSSILPIIPYGGFSPVRLEGWLIRRSLPVRRSAQACSRHTLVIVQFASVLRALRGSHRWHRSESGLRARLRTRNEAECSAYPRGPRSGPGC